MSKNNQILRTISLLLIQALLLEQVAFAAPDFKPAKLEIFSKPKIDLGIPESIAMVEDSWTADKNDRRIYLIQDAHTNTSGQFNLSKTLDLLLQKNPEIQYVFVEAGLGDNSLSQFRKYGTAEDRRKVAEPFLRGGELHGEEYLQLTSERDFILWGVEDMALYRKAFEDYRDVAKNREKFETYLQKIQVTINTLKPQLYNPSLALFEAQYARYKKDELPLTTYFEILRAQVEVTGIRLTNYPHLESLKKLQKLESGIDFKKANEEQVKAIQTLSLEDQKEILNLAKEQRKPSKLSSQERREEKAFFALLEDRLRNESSYPELSKYFAYLKSSKDLNPQEILKEIKLLETQLFSELARTPDEKSLHRCQEAVYLLEKLFKFQLTPEEYKGYQALTQDFDITQLTGFLNKKIMDLKTYYERAVFLEEGYDPMVQKAENFYALTYTRDVHFVEEALKKIPSGAAVLITGGFHTPNLKSLLKEKGVSFVSVVPQVLQETNQARYEKLLLGQEKTLNQLRKVSLGMPTATLRTFAQRLMTDSPVLKRVSEIPIEAHASRGTRRLVEGRRNLESVMSAGGGARLAFIQEIFTEFLDVLIWPFSLFTVPIRKVGDRVWVPVEVAERIHKRDKLILYTSIQLDGRGYGGYLATVSHVSSNGEFEVYYGGPPVQSETPMQWFKKRTPEVITLKKGARLANINDDIRELRKNLNEAADILAPIVESLPNFKTLHHQITDMLANDLESVQAWTEMGADSLDRTAFQQALVARRTGLVARLRTLQTWVTGYRIGGDEEVDRMRVALWGYLGNDIKADRLIDRFEKISTLFYEVLTQLKFDIRPSQVSLTVRTSAKQTLGQAMEAARQAHEYRSLADRSTILSESIGKVTDPQGLVLYQSRFFYDVQAQFQGSPVEPNADALSYWPPDLDMEVPANTKISIMLETGARLAAIPEILKDILLPATALSLLFYFIKIVLDSINAPEKSILADDQAHLRHGFELTGNKAGEMEGRVSVARKRVVSKADTDLLDREQRKIAAVRDQLKSEPAYLTAKFSAGRETLKALRREATQKMESLDNQLFDIQENLDAFIASDWVLEAPDGEVAVSWRKIGWPLPEKANETLLRWNHPVLNLKEMADFVTSSYSAWKSAPNAQERILPFIQFAGALKPHFFWFVEHIHDTDLNLTEAEREFVVMSLFNSMGSFPSDFFLEDKDLEFFWYLLLRLGLLQKKAEASGDSASAAKRIELIQNLLESAVGRIGQNESRLTIDPFREFFEPRLLELGGNSRATFGAFIIDVMTHWESWKVSGPDKIIKLSEPSPDLLLSDDGQAFQETDERRQAKEAFRRESEALVIPPISQYIDNEAWNRPAEYLGGLSLQADTMWLDVDHSLEQMLRYTDADGQDDFPLALQFQLDLLRQLGANGVREWAFARATVYLDAIWGSLPAEDRLSLPEWTAELEKFLNDWKTPLSIRSYLNISGSLDPTHEMLLNFWERVKEAARPHKAHTTLFVDLQETLKPKLNVRPDFSLEQTDHPSKELDRFNLWKADSSKKVLIGSIGGWPGREGDVFGSYGQKKVLRAALWQSYDKPSYVLSRPEFFISYAAGQLLEDRREKVVGIPIADNPGLVSFIRSKIPVTDTGGELVYDGELYQLAALQAVVMIKFELPSQPAIGARLAFNHNFDPESLLISPKVNLARGDWMEWTPNVRNRPSRLVSHYWGDRFTPDLSSVEGLLLNLQKAFNLIMSNRGFFVGLNESQIDYLLRARAAIQSSAPYGLVIDMRDAFWDRDSENSLQAKAEYERATSRTYPSLTLWMTTSFIQGPDLGALLQLVLAAFHDPRSRVDFKKDKAKGKLRRPRNNNKGSEIAQTITSSLLSLPKTKPAARLASSAKEASFYEDLFNLGFVARATREENIIELTRLDGEPLDQADAMAIIHNGLNARYELRLEGANTIKVSEQRVVRLWDRTGKIYDSLQWEVSSELPNLEVNSQTGQIRYAQDAKPMIDLDIPNSEVLFVRHGETDGNVEQVFQGAVDEPRNHLNDEGRRQAAEAAKLTYDALRSQIEAGAQVVVLSSPLSRAYDTANTFVEYFEGQRGERPIFDEEGDRFLREISFGVVDNHNINEIEGFPNEMIKEASRRFVMEYRGSLNATAKAPNDPDRGEEGVAESYLDHVLRVLREYPAFKERLLRHQQNANGRKTIFVFFGHGSQSTALRVLSSDPAMMDPEKEIIDWRKQIFPNAKPVQWSAQTKTFEAVLPAARLAASSNRRKFILYSAALLGFGGVVGGFIATWVLRKQERGRVGAIVRAHNKIVATQKAVDHLNSLIFHFKKTGVVSLPGGQSSTFLELHANEEGLSVTLGPVDKISPEYLEVYTALEAAFKRLPITGVKSGREAARLLALIREDLIVGRFQEEEGFRARIYEEIDLIIRRAEDPKKTFEMFFPHVFEITQVEKDGFTIGQTSPDDLEPDLQGSYLLLRGLMDEAMNEVLNRKIKGGRQIVLEAMRALRLKLEKKVLKPTNPSPKPAPKLFPGDIKEGDLVLSTENPRQHLINHLRRSAELGARFARNKPVGSEADKGDRFPRRVLIRTASLLGALGVSAYLLLPRSPSKTPTPWNGKPYSNNADGFRSFVDENIRWFESMGHPQLSALKEYREYIGHDENLQVVHDDPQVSLQKGFVSGTSKIFVAVNMKMINQLVSIVRAKSLSFEEARSLYFLILGASLNREAEGLARMRAHKNTWAQRMASIKKIQIDEKNIIESRKSEAQIDREISGLYLNRRRQIANNFAFLLAAEVNEVRAASEVFGWIKKQGFFSNAWVESGLAKLSPDARAMATLLMQARKSSTEDLKQEQRIHFELTLMAINYENILSTSPSARNPHLAAWIQFRNAMSALHQDTGGMEGVDLMSRGFIQDRARMAAAERHLRSFVLEQLRFLEGGDTSTQTPLNRRNQLRGALGVSRDEISAARLADLSRAASMNLGELNAPTQDILTRPLSRRVVLRALGQATGLVIGSPASAALQTIGKLTARQLPLFPVPPAPLPEFHEAVTGTVPFVPARLATTKLQKQVKKLLSQAENVRTFSGLYRVVRKLEALEGLSFAPAVKHIEKYKMGDAAVKLEYAKKFFRLFHATWSEEDGLPEGVLRDVKADGDGRERYKVLRKYPRGRIMKGVFTVRNSLKESGEGEAPTISLRNKLEPVKSFIEETGYDFDLAASLEFRKSNNQENTITGSYKRRQFFNYFMENLSLYWGKNRIKTVYINSSGNAIQGLLFTVNVLKKLEILPKDLKVVMVAHPGLDQKKKQKIENDYGETFGGILEIPAFVNEAKKVGMFKGKSKASVNKALLEINLTLSSLDVFAAEHNKRNPKEPIAHIRPSNDESMVLGGASMMDNLLRGMKKLGFKKPHYVGIPLGGGGPAAGMAIYAFYMEDEEGYHTKVYANTSTTTVAGIGGGMAIQAPQSIVRQVQKALGKDRLEFGRIPEPLVYKAFIDLQEAGFAVEPTSAVTLARLYWIMSDPSQWHLLKPGPDGQKKVIGLVLSGGNFGPDVVEHARAMYKRDRMKGLNYLWNTPITDNFIAQDIVNRAKKYFTVASANLSTREPKGEAFLRRQLNQIIKSAQKGVTTAKTRREAKNILQRLKGLSAARLASSEVVKLVEEDVQVKAQFTADGAWLSVFYLDMEKGFFRKELVSLYGGALPIKTRSPQDLEVIENLVRQDIVLAVGKIQKFGKGSPQDRLALARRFIKLYLATWREDGTPEGILPKVSPWPDPAAKTALLNKYPDQRIENGIRNVRANLLIPSGEGEVPVVRLTDKFATLNEAREKLGIDIELVASLEYRTEDNKENTLTGSFKRRQFINYFMENLEKFSTDNPRRIKKVYINSSGNAIQGLLFTVKVLKKLGLLPEDVQVVMVAHNNLDPEKKKKIQSKYPGHFGGILFIKDFIREARGLEDVFPKDKTDDELEEALEDINPVLSGIDRYVAAYNLAHPEEPIAHILPSNGESMVLGGASISRNLREGAKKLGLGEVDLLLMPVGGGGPIGGGAVEADLYERNTGHRTKAVGVTSDITVSSIADGMAIQAPQSEVMEIQRALGSDALAFERVPEEFFYKAWVELQEAGFKAEPTSAASLAYIYWLISDPTKREQLKPGPDGKKKVVAFMLSGSNYSEEKLDHVRTIYAQENMAGLAYLTGAARLAAKTKTPGTVALNRELNEVLWVYNASTNDLHQITVLEIKKEEKQVRVSVGLADAEGNVSSPKEVTLTLGVDTPDALPGILLGLTEVEKSQAKIAFPGVSKTIKIARGELAAEEMGKISGINLLEFMRDRFRVGARLASAWKSVEDITNLDVIKRNERSSAIAVILHSDQKSREAMASAAKELGFKTVIEANNIGSLHGIMQGRASVGRERIGFIFAEPINKQNKRNVYIEPLKKYLSADFAVVSNESFLGGSQPEVFRPVMMAQAKEIALDRLKNKDVQYLRLNGLILVELLLHMMREDKSSLSVADIEAFGIDGSEFRNATKHLTGNGWARQKEGVQKASRTELVITDEGEDFVNFATVNGKPNKAVLAKLLLLKPEEVASYKALIQAQRTEEAQRRVATPAARLADVRISTADGIHVQVSESDELSRPKGVRVLVHGPHRTAGNDVVYFDDILEIPSKDTLMPAYLQRVANDVVLAIQEATPFLVSLTATNLALAIKDRGYKSVETAQGFVDRVRRRVDEAMEKEDRSFIDLQIYYNGGRGADYQPFSLTGRYVRGVSSFWDSLLSKLPVDGFFTGLDIHLSDKRLHSGTILIYHTPSNQKRSSASTSRRGWSTPTASLIAARLARRDGARLNQSLRSTDAVHYFLKQIGQPLQVKSEKVRMALAAERGQVLVYTLQRRPDELLVHVGDESYVLDVTSGKMDPIRRQEALRMQADYDEELSQNLNTLLSANQQARPVVPSVARAVYLLDLGSFSQSKFELSNLLKQQAAQLSPASVVVFLGNDAQVGLAQDLVRELGLKNAHQFIARESFSTTDYQGAPHILLTKQGHEVENISDFSNLSRITLRADEGGQVGVFAYGVVGQIMRELAEGHLTLAFEHFLTANPQHRQDGMTIQDFQDYLAGKKDVVSRFAFLPTVWASFRQAIQLYQLSRVTETNA